jgi:hypothetical protein
MSGNPNQSSQPTPDSPGHDSIWRGSPNRRESAASWESMLEVLSLDSAPPEERTSSRHLFSGAQQQPSHGALTPSWQIPPIIQQQQPSHGALTPSWQIPPIIQQQQPSHGALTPSWQIPPIIQQQQPSHGALTPSWQIPPIIQQQQPSHGALTPSWQIPPIIQQQQPTLRQQTAFGQPSFEEPPRPPTRRSNQDDSTQPPTTAPATQHLLRYTLHPANFTTPQPQLLAPLAGHIAAYLAIYEGHPRRTDPLNLTRPSRRNSSIIVQTNAHSDKYREFCCIATPQRWPKRQVQFYSSPEIPDPRWTAPGLLAMQFIAWIPRGQIAELDKYMKSWRRRVNDSWTHNTWIGLYLESLVQQRLISQDQMERTMIFQAQAFRIPYTEALPNDRQCFPHLY